MTSAAASGTGGARWLATSSGPADLYLDGTKFEQVGFAIAWREKDRRKFGRGWIEASVEALGLARTRKAELDWGGGRVVVSVQGPDPSGIRTPWRADGERWRLTAGEPPPSLLDNVLLVPED